MEIELTPIAASLEIELTPIAASDCRLKVVPQSRRSFEEGFSLYQARLDKKYSLIDCISMEAMRRNGITKILTHDGNFTREGFTILL